MVGSLTQMTRDLSPVEHLILKLLCNGQSNLCISEKTHYSVKTIENTISRSARVLGVVSAPNVNMRVLLAISYRINFGEIEFQLADLPLKEVSAAAPAA